MQQQIVGGHRPPSTTSSQQQQQLSRSTASSAFPGSLSDLVMSFENVKQKGALHL
jgi:CCR4-NOT transcription complex subunit 3